MSTLNVNKIADASGGVLAPVSSVMRNRIINGAMTISQRNGTSSVTVNGGTQFGVDRFFGEDDTDGAFTLQQSTVAPEGFTNSLLATITTADTSLSSAQLAIIGHRVEGFNIADLGWGTANAKAVTLSFWVRSSLTGTFGGALWNSAGDRSYPYSYTIAAANTWEQKTVTIAGDTTGTWLTTNGRGISISWSLGVGSTYQATAGTWASALELSSTGETSVIGTNGATFYITGVQLEKGTQATGFEYRQYGQELALCQRYYAQVGRQLVGRTESATVATMVCSTPVRMRTAPTFTLINGTNAIAVPGIANYTVTIAANSSSDNAIYVSFFSTGMSNPTVTVGNIDTVLGASSEL